jgi:hypothetical protein
MRRGLEMAGLFDTSSPQQQHGFDWGSAALGFFGVPASLIQAHTKRKAEQQQQQLIFNAIDNDPNLSDGQRAIAKLYPGAYAQSQLQNLGPAMPAASGGYAVANANPSTANYLPAGPPAMAMGAIDPTMGQPLGAATDSSSIPFGWGDGTAIGGATASVVPLTDQDVSGMDQTGGYDPYGGYGSSYGFDSDYGNGSSDGGFADF